MGASLHRCAARTKGSARWQAVVLLVLLLVRVGGEISGEQEEMRILHPSPDVVVSAVSPLEMRCSFAGLRGAEDFSVTIDLDEFDGGEFPIAADGEYSFTLPPLAEGRHELFMALLHAGEVRVRQHVSFASSTVPPPPPPLREEKMPTLAITGPAQCQRLPASDVTTISTSADFGSLLPQSEDSKLTLEINGGHQQPMATGHQQLNIAQMPQGLHVLTLRADWTSASGERKFLRTKPL